MNAIRLVHVSDVHVTTRSRWRMRDVFSKRLTSWVNLRVRGRARHFPHTGPQLAALRRDLLRRPVDGIVFSGDSTALGFREEIESAADQLGVRRDDLPPGLAVPGNHDYLTPAAERSGHFEAAFAPWQHGERIDDHPYPFARKVGPAWLVAVNSCVGNVLPQDARGRVGAAQLGRLERLLATLDGGPRILVTHYPVCRADGRPERRFHALRDVAELVRVAEAGKVSLWLHGHRHDHYALTPPGCSFPVICAGSTTQHGSEGYFEYVLDGFHLEATAHRYDPTAATFSPGRTFALELPER